MKKRRELDALVNNGKASKNGRHELLRNESESSEEVEEFAMPHRSVVRKRMRSQCCSTCLTMCGTFLLVICIVSIGGLIWMVVQLKYDVIDLQNRLSSAEVDSKNAKDKLNELSSSDTDLVYKVDKLTSTDIGFPKLQGNVSELNKRLVSVNATLIQLSESFKNLHIESSQSGLKEFQDTVSHLSQTVADMGSSLQSLEQQQTTFALQLTGLQSDVKALQIAGDTQSSTTPSVTSKVDEAVQNLQQEVAMVSSNLMAVNQTFSRKFENINKSLLVQINRFVGICWLSIGEGADVIIEQDTLIDVKNWTLQLWKEHDEFGKLDIRLINNTVISEVNRYLHSTTKQANSTPGSASYGQLESRIAVLENAEYNHTADILHLTSTLGNVNQTLRQYISRSWHHEKMLNETVRSLADRVQKVELAVDSGKPVRHDFVIPVTAEVAGSVSGHQNDDESANIWTTTVTNLEEAESASSDVQ